MAIASKGTVAWLTKSDQPSIRYFALRELLGKGNRDTEVRLARSQIPIKGWARQILDAQRPVGTWVSDESLYRPKYVCTNWMLLVLSDLGLTKENPRVKKSAELWMKRFAKADGGFGVEDDPKSELCIVGNTARALIRFGYEDHPKVQSAIDWLVKNQKDNGGWHCFGDEGVIDAWEGMSAFASYPRQKWTRSVKNSVEKGAEFYLERRLHREGRAYAPWYRLHYPAQYFYDILVGLDVITALGFTDDLRLKDDLDRLKAKMSKAGRWKLDAAHPDATVGYKRAVVNGRITPFALEDVGMPSQMITLKALTVLQRTER